MPGPRDLIMMSRGTLDLWCQSHPKAPKSIALDIDDTADNGHGHQQKLLFNARQDERCFAPTHTYDTDTGDCLTTAPRPSKPPSGKEVRAHPLALAEYADPDPRRQPLWPR